MAMTTRTQKISVLMPVKNGSKYLTKIKKDIIANIQVSDQVVIINDGSSDDTNKILDQWSDDIKNIKIITTKGVGIVESLNLGINECENNWIARFDVDDEYANNRIDKQLTCITAETVAVFADYDFIDDFGNGFGHMSSPLYSQATAISLFNSTRTAHSVALINKSALLEAGGYLEEDFPAEDLSLWLRLSKLGNLLSVPDSLLKYRIRKGSVTNKKRKNALSKKHNLLKSIGVDLPKIKYCNQNINYILNSYTNTPSETNRKILFLRDLIAANKNCAINLDFRFISAFIREMSSYSSINELRHLSEEQKKRSKLRKSLE